MCFSHLTEIVFCCVPHHRGARVDPGPVLLHDDARDYVLVRLVERLELLEAIVDDCVGPVGHLYFNSSDRVVVGVHRYYSYYTVQYWYNAGFVLRAVHSDIELSLIHI